MIKYKYRFKKDLMLSLQELNPSEGNENAQVYISQFEAEAELGVL